MPARGVSLTSKLPNTTGDDAPDRVNALYSKATSIKNDMLRLSRNPDDHLRAAELFDEAARRSAAVAADSKRPASVVAQSKILAASYAYEAEDCRFMYWYNKHDCTQAREHHARGQSHLTKTLALYDEQSPHIDHNIRRGMEEGVAKHWRFRHMTDRALALMIDAREAFDEERYTAALDCYRSGLRLLNEAHDFAVENHRAEHLMRAIETTLLVVAMNIRQATRGVLLESSEHGDDGARTLPHSAMVVMLSAAMQVSRLAKKALARNPAHVDELSLAIQSCESDVKGILQDNPHAWMHLHIDFEDDNDFLKLMRKTDLDKYRQLELRRTAKEHPFFRKWVQAITVLVLLAFCALIALVALKVLPIPQAIAFFAGTTLLSIVAMVSLFRVFGLMSEQGLVEVLKEALKCTVGILRPSDGTESNGDI